MVHCSRSCTENGDGLFCQVGITFRTRYKIQAQHTTDKNNNNNNTIIHHTTNNELSY